MTRAASARPTTPPTTPAINPTLGPEEEVPVLDSWLSDWAVCVLAGLLVRVDVVRVVCWSDCVVVSVGVTVGAGAGDEIPVDSEVTAVVVNPVGATDGELVETADGKPVELSDVDRDVDEEVDADVDTDDTDAEPAAGATVMSNGGLYSKVLVKSSRILKPYLSPAGKVLLPWRVLGMVHTKVPVFSIEALSREFR